MATANVTMVLIGDTYVQRADPDSAFAPARPWLEKADVGFCNLETVIAAAKYLAPWDHDPRPRTDESILPAYTRAGINVMNVANNPIVQHGLDAFLRCMDVLDEAGVVHGGGGHNLAEARKPAIIERNGTKIAFVCRTSVGMVEGAARADRGGVARFRVATAYEPRNRVLEVPGSPPIIHTIPDPADRESLEADIRAARAQADLVVVSWHWGVSPATGGHGELAEYQTEMGHFAIDVGADLVVGHHPHLLQPIEVYKGGIIFYSLGNYVHDMASFEGAHEAPAMLVHCLIRDAKLSKTAFIPGRIAGKGPAVFARPREAEDVVRHMMEISAPLGTRFEVEDDEVSVQL